MTTFNVANLGEIETHLAAHAYLSGAAFPNAEDVRVFSELKGIPDRKANPTLYHWYNFIALFSPATRDVWSGKAATATQAPKKEAPVKTEQKPADVKTAATAEGKAKKPKPVAKSIVIFDIKVYEIETNLEELAKKVYALQIDGLVWNTNLKILPVAFGMNKLQVACVVEDDKVDLEDLYELIQEWEDVQSTDVVSMQKV